MDLPIPLDFDPWLPERRGRTMLEVCQGPACREVGGQELLQALEALTGVKAGQTGSDGRYTLLGVPCFGRCALGANARIKGIFCHNLDPRQAATLLQEPDTNT